MARPTRQLGLLLALLLGIQLTSWLKSTLSAPSPQPSLSKLKIVAAPEPPAPTEVHDAPAEIEQPAAEAEPVTMVPTKIESSPPPSPPALDASTNIAGANPICSESPSAALRRARQPFHVPSDWRRKRDASFATYIQLHKAFFAKGGTSTADVPGRGNLPRKFILVKPCCQLCNRVRVLVAALALGILTDRAVTIEFDGNGHEGDYYGRLDDLFDSPMKLQARLPRDIEKTRTPVTAESAYGGGDDGDGGLHVGAGGTIGRNMPWLSMMSEFMCMDPLKQWKESVVTLQGSPGFLHTLYLNPSLQEVFNERFGGLDGLFAAIFYRLLRPQRAIVEQARSFVDGLLLPSSSKSRGGGADGEEKAVMLDKVDPASWKAPKGFVVGLHVRNGRDFRTRKLLSDEWERLSQCANALVPPTADGSDGSSSKSSSHSGPVRFAVATESGESRNAAATALGPKAAFYEKPLPKGKDGGTTSREGAKRALLELLIVSMSNSTILTPMSSFSETAAALSGRPGMYFHFDLSRKFHFESATEAVQGCFVPWTAEMPGSMNLHSVIGRLPPGCAKRVKAHEGPTTLWTRPCGLRFLDGKSKLPEKLAKKVTTY